MVTILSDGKHIVQRKVPIHHNHTLKASRLIVEITIISINNKVIITWEKPSQITFHDAYSKSRKKNLKIRRKLLPPELSSID